MWTGFVKWLRNHCTTVKTNKKKTLTSVIHNLNNTLFILFIKYSDLDQQMYSTKSYYCTVQYFQAFDNWLH